MPESISHMSYVNILLEYVKTLVPSSCQKLICVDSPISVYKPPRTSNNFVPDLYYNYNGILILGEAKTADDVEKKHSISQYEDYYRDAVNSGEESIIVISVPWTVKNTVKNIFRNISKCYDEKIEVHVITDLMKVEVL